jgi:hypothetical protein
MPLSTLLIPETRISTWEWGATQKIQLLRWLFFFAWIYFYFFQDVYISR